MDEGGRRVESASAQYCDAASAERSAVSCSTVATRSTRSRCRMRNVFWTMGPMFEELVFIDRRAACESANLRRTDRVDRCELRAEVVQF